MKTKQIKKIFHKWTYRLGLRWWDVTLNLFDDPQEIIKHFQTSENNIVVATTWADWRYTTCTIGVNLPEMKKMIKYDAEKVIIHELCHALVCEMREDGIDHEERVVTMLTNAFVWTKDDCKVKS